MTTKKPLPIDDEEPMAFQSRHALMMATEERWGVRYRRPVTLRTPEQRAELRKELGAKAALPSEEGIYYLVYLDTQQGESVALLLPEGDARVAVFVWAVCVGVDAARRVQYRHGTLPVPTNTPEALSVIAERRWTFYRPVNMSIPEQVSALREELGAKAALPTDGGNYVLMYMSSRDDGPVAVLIPEEDASAARFAGAAWVSRSEARLVQYQSGILPL